MTVLFGPLTQQQALAVQRINADWARQDPSRNWTIGEHVVRRAAVVLRELAGDDAGFLCAEIRVFPPPAS